MRWLDKIYCEPEQGHDTSRKCLTVKNALQGILKGASSFVNKYEYVILPITVDWSNTSLPSDIERPSMNNTSYLLLYTLTNHVTCYQCFITIIPCLVFSMSTWYNQHTSPVLNDTSLYLYLPMSPLDGIITIWLWN